MTPENYIKGQLAAYAIAEASHHGGTENMAAIAHVIHNRVSRGWFGGDWMQVIETAGAQVGTIYPAASANLRSAAVRSFLARIDDIFRGAEEDFTSGALFYCELNNVNRDWFKQNVLADLAHHPRIATVGPVSFFG